MAAAKKQTEALRVSIDRLAAIAGGGGVEMAVTAESDAPRRRVELKPDLSRIRPRGINETPEQKARRLTAKKINFTMTFLARLAIMGAVAYLMKEVYEGTGSIHRGYAMGMFVMVADFGRVILKAMEPGTK
ncbi:hypothetical protein [Hyphococcus sp.]|uniref:hypothetical protein n=1 Tax=Hyphococcus sp. TaxID=2038636 RepID=UPI0020806C49|nr:MAG: hypothetical protein DHS20C04_20850 [Marinicaulis sp.]